MPGIIILIIIIGAAIGLITFFVLRSVIAPKKMSTLYQMLKQGKTSNIIRMAKQIIAKDPRNVEARYVLGQAFQQENKPELALMEYKQINNLGNFGGYVPEHEFREKMGDLYTKYGQLEEALKEYLLLIKLNPENDNYYYIAGTLFEQREKPDKALNYFRKTLQLNPRHSHAYFKLGMLLYKAKKNVEAKNQFEKAISLNPENYEAHFYMGKLLKENNDFVAALHSFEKAQRDPELKSRSLLERGSCFISTKSYDSAIGELERALKIATPANNSQELLYIKYFLASCYEQKRNIDKAVELWEQVYAVRANFRDVSEKLSNYQDLRTDDRVKDFLTVPMDLFYEICKRIALGMNLSVRDISDSPNGCQLTAVDAENKWRNVKKIPKLIRFLRVPEMITESAIRSLHEDMKSQGIGRGIIIASSNFSRKAIDFAESRPIELYNKDKLQKLLSKIEMP